MTSPGEWTSVTTPDNAVVNTSYSANSVTVTDQAGKARKSVSDALGRLVEVYEDPDVPGGPAELNFQTTYLYDALDNLVKVTQGSQQRFFMYDSLKRLIRARNPEQGTHVNLNLSDPITSNNTWSAGYDYDSNGNLIKKTDARGVESIYAYDALNRNIEIDYTDTTLITPDVKWFYDGATNGKGRFWHFYKGGDLTNGQEVDHTSVDSYDALGRPRIKRQSFKSGGNWSPNTYQIERKYNRAGGVTWQKYPSQHTVSYNYDVAGRLGDTDTQNLAFVGNLGDGVQRTYASGISYSQWGSMSREQFGTNTAVYKKLHYNIRGQLCDVRASNVDQEWSGELGALVNYYSTPREHCGSGTDNNGNVLMSQTIINSYYMEDRYSYDALNRLTAVDEWQNATIQTGSQQYDYDRWGNRTIKSATWGTGINNKQFTIETATNRIYAPGDLGVPENQRQMRYDAAGNLTNDTYTGAGLREYDAENRMTRAWGGNNQSQYYTYDADGHRVRRKVEGQETWQIYGFAGELLAEYAANRPPTSLLKEYGYRNGQLLVTAEMRNVASASNGATVSASSTLSNPPYSYPVSAVSNSDRKGLNAGNGGNWCSSTATFPQSIEVVFDGSKTINEIDVFSLQDNYANPIEPTEATAFSLYGLTGFQAQYWNGSAWVTVPGGSVSGNDKVWKKITFAPLITTKIRVLISATVDNLSRMVEVEAWSPNINWLVTDHLGTPRMVIDTTGTLANIKRHDYLPFGEELFAGVGGRSAGNGYASGDGVRQQFTSYERDTESSLDFAEARYYSSSQGRFTSIDPLMASAVLTNPQTFNRYSYVTNSPLTTIDPTGMIGIIPLDGLTKVEPQQPAPAQSTPPPPGGPVSAGPIKIDIGPVPLLPGEEPWPTTLEVVQGNNKGYNGDPLVSPSGEILDQRPHYGVGMTIDYIIRDQAGNPMSTGVLLTETVTATNPQAQALMGNVRVNKDPVKPDSRGIVPDTTGAINPNPSTNTFLSQNQINATFSQTLTVYGTVGREYRTALTLENQYQLTNSGVTMTVGTIQQHARPK